MTATCHQSSPATYCDVLEAEIERFVSVVRGVDLDVQTVTCPDWSLAALIEHTGGVHRWAAAQVRVLTPERIGGSAIELGLPDDRRLLPEWLSEGGKELVETLRGADHDAEMWAWGSDKHARFWPRRMVHETAVHRADAEITLGAEAAIDAALAVDGIDEFLDNLSHAVYFAPNVANLRGDGQTLRFECPEATWRVRLGPDGFAWEHAADGPADVVVSGSGRDLLLYLYGRGETGISTSGDGSVLALWRNNSSI